MWIQCGNLTLLLIIYVIFKVYNSNSLKTLVYMTFKKLNMPLLGTYLDVLETAIRDIFRALQYWNIPFKRPYMANFFAHVSLEDN